ncbi:MAG: SpoIIE family protein phosphatase [Deltaproteobacteria bacterium]|nr:SpoIIE family protein phosphatase [Deltaproteobacteria bacterium]
MKLRTQVLLAFSLLAILPLGIIVLYSYLSSEKAFQEAVEAEGARLAEEMGDLLGSSRQDLRTRVRALSRLPLAQLAEAGPDGLGEEGEELLLRLQLEIGPSALLLDRLEFIPEASPGPEGAPDAPQPPIPPRAIPLIESWKETAEGLSELGLREGVNRALAEMEEVLTGVSQMAVSQAVAEGESAAPESFGLSSLLAQELGFPVLDEEEVVGRIAARIKGPALVASVLARAPRGNGQLPFALDAAGGLYPASSRDRQTLASLVDGIDDSDWLEQPTRTQEGWIVVTREVPGTGLRFGVAQPVLEPLQQIQRNAFRNLIFGIGLVGLAFLGLLPLTTHITRHLSALTRGAERIAAGDLQARVPVYSENEIGQLARTFNRMAFELSENQLQLLEQERMRQQQELQQQLLLAENSRKTQELEEARSFQLSLLPKVLPSPPGLEIAVYTKTATEVGGDYYDFHLAQDGTLTTAIGDATGHGARAGTMVAVIKSLFSAHGSRQELTAFLSEAAQTIKGMELKRMAMALALARIADQRLTVASAGMPPPLLYRHASKEVEEIALEGMPLGGLLGFPYACYETDLAAGDTLLLMTDGFPEMLDHSGEAYGYDGVRKLFSDVAEGSPEQVISALARGVEAESQGQPLPDDTTFVVLQVT